MEITSQNAQSVKDLLLIDNEKIKAFETAFSESIKQGDYIDFKQNKQWIVAHVKTRSQSILMITFDGFDPETKEAL